MRDDQRGAPCSQTLECIEHGHPAALVQSGRRLVQNHDRRVAHHRAGHGDALTLTARKGHATLAHHGVVPERQTFDEGVRVGSGRRLHHLFGRGFTLRGAKRDVLGDRADKQQWLLLHRGNPAARGSTLELAQVATIDQNRAFGRIIQP